MKIVHAAPPNIDAIDAAFGVKGKRGIIFAYGDTIYVPDGGHVSDAIKAHEAVHGERQGNDPDGWWRRYIADLQFRLDEEIAAHRAEYQYWARQPNAGRPMPGFRSRLACHELRIAQRLASPLYGNLISLVGARSYITQAG